VDNINLLFNKKRNDPDIYRSLPVTAGSIYWEKALFHRIKHTIVRFLSVENMLNSDIGKMTKAHYLCVAKKMKKYEDELYSSWAKRVEISLPQLMRKHLLSTYSNLEKSEKSASVLLVEINMENLRYSVNFNSDLYEIISESKYLEKIGFKIPDMTKNVSLQEEQYIHFVTKLNKICKKYDETINLLSLSEIDLLTTQIIALQRGNGKFESLVNQIHKEYFNNIRSNLNDTLKVLAQKYKEIAPLLIKIETLVVLTSTGKEPRLKKYYAYWEKKIYESLISMIITNFKHFRDALNSNRPLFTIEAILIPPDAVLSPLSNDIYKIILQSIRDAIEEQKIFYRWMNGTCIEVPPQKMANGELCVFSYFYDISLNADILDIVYEIQTNIKKMLYSLTKSIYKWRKFRTMWRQDKVM
ncbi:hypothetical protein A3Q56_07698, partial [Intoshia linei]